MRKRSVMATDPQKIHNAALDLLNRKTPFGRAVLFKQLGGNLRRPDLQPWEPEEYSWHAALFGISRQGTTCAEAIQNWAQAGLAGTTRRATDGRPECPYNGTGLAPSPRNQLEIHNVKPN
jgi:hypothetical protein